MASALTRVMIGKTVMADEAAAKAAITEIHSMAEEEEEGNREERVVQAVARLIRQIHSTARA